MELESGGLGVRSQGSGVRSQGSGVRSQGSGVRGQGSGVRGQESGVRGWIVELAVERKSERVDTAYSPRLREEELSAADNKRAAITSCRP